MQYRDGSTPALTRQDCDEGNTAEQMYDAEPTPEIYTFRKYKRDNCYDDRKNGKLHWRSISMRPPRQVRESLCVFCCTPASFSGNKPGTRVTSKYCTILLRVLLDPRCTDMSPLSMYQL